MEKEAEQKLYIGLSLDDRQAVISFYRQGMGEPQEAASAADPQKTSFPLALLKLPNGKYYYGDEAIRFCREEGGIFHDDLYRKALADQAAPEREDLFYLIRRLLYFRRGFESDRSLSYDLTITVPTVTPEVIGLMEAIRRNLSIHRDCFRVTDHKESFFDYVTLQDRSIWKQDVFLFALSDDQLICRRAFRSPAGAGRYMEVEEQVMDLPEDAKKEDAALDLFLASELKRALSGRSVSGVYLIGKRFAGDWRKQTMDALGSGKRIFIGENLDSRGACLGACRLRTLSNPQILYHCQYRVYQNRYLRVLNRQQPVFLPLLTPHANWFESYAGYRLLYNGKQHLEIWADQSGQATDPCAVLELEGFPKRPPKAMYLDLSAYLISEKELCIELTDAGFGGQYESGQKTWKFIIDLGEEVA